MPEGYKERHESREERDPKAWLGGGVREGPSPLKKLLYGVGVVATVAVIGAATYLGYQWGASSANKEFKKEKVSIMESAHREGYDAGQADLLKKPLLEEAVLIPGQYKNEGKGPDLAVKIFGKGDWEYAEMQPDGSRFKTYTGMANSYSRIEKLLNSNDPRNPLNTPEKYSKPYVAPLDIPLLPFHLQPSTSAPEITPAQPKSEPIPAPKIVPTQPKPEPEPGPVLTFPEPPPEPKPEFPTIYNNEAPLPPPCQQIQPLPPAYMIPSQIPPACAPANPPIIFIQPQNNQISDSGWRPSRR